MNFTADNTIEVGSVVTRMVDGKPAPLGSELWFEGRVLVIVANMAKVRIFAGPPGKVGGNEPFFLHQLCKTGRSA